MWVQGGVKLPKPLPYIDLAKSSYKLKIRNILGAQRDVLCP